MTGYLAHLPTVETCGNSHSKTSGMRTRTRIVWTQIVVSAIAIVDFGRSPRLAQQSDARGALLTHSVLLPPCNRPRRPDACARAARRTVRRTPAARDAQYSHARAHPCRKRRNVFRKPGVGIPVPNFCVALNKQPPINHTAGSSVAHRAVWIIGTGGCPPAV